MKQVFGKETVFIRSGGSIPIVGDFERHLKIPTVMMGFGLPDDNLHAPNEKFHIANFHRGIESIILLFEELGSGLGRVRKVRQGMPKTMPQLCRVCVRTTVPSIVPQGRLNLAQDASPGLGRERCLVPQGRLNPFPAVSAVPAGLAELLDVFPGLTSWAKFRRPCGTEIGWKRKPIRKWS